MQNKQQHIPGSTACAENEFAVSFRSEPLAVREALESAVTCLQSLQISEEARGTIELVLAEVLNNIVEHAYAEHPVGLIELRFRLENGELYCKVIDEGVPMPGGTLPEPKSHDLDCPVHDLPEGGFGWYLIHELADDLEYARIGVKNQLSFRLNKSEPSSVA